MKKQVSLVNGRVERVLDLILMIGFCAIVQFILSFFN